MHQQFKWKMVMATVAMYFMLSSSENNPWNVNFTMELSEQNQTKMLADSGMIFGMVTGSRKCADSQNDIAL